MSSDESFLHADTVRILAMMNRPGAVPYHELKTEQQRAASEQLMFAFRPAAPEVAMALEATFQRPVEAGGPVHYRLYRPLGAHREDILPALVWFHGGGWTVGNIESYEVLCRELANLAHCAVIAPAYRLAPEHPFPAGVDDAWFALQAVAAHAGELHVDPTRLAVGGDSAGGNLAAVAALHARDAGLGGLAGLRFQLLVYPAADQRGITPSHNRFGDGYLLTQETIRMFQRGYLQREEDYSDWRASPILAESLAGLPPALVIAASHDPLVDDCRAFAARLLEEDVTTEWIEYSGVVHGFFGLGKAFTLANDAVAKAAAALRSAFGS